MSGITVTLVVPVLNEAATLGPLLTSVERQTLAPDAVVFVDGGSRDSTVQTLRDHCSRHRHWQVIEAGSATPGRGRNVGVAASDTEWVALTDAGIELEAHWLERLVRVAETDANVDIVYGHYEPVTDGWFVTCAALAYVQPHASTPKGPMRSRFVASCLLRTSLWAEVGGFPDLRAAEDLLFMRGVDRVGAQVGLAPEAVAHWRLQPTLRSTFRRFRLYSRVNVEIGEQANWHYAVARMYLMGLPFLAAARRRRAWGMVPVAGLMVRVARSIWGRREGRDLLWAANPARFVVVGMIMVTLDLATFAGWLDALVARRRAG
jgi:glycosyltransferase involved in cell wall biosynthesis